jgi:hypothetical protein
MKNLVNYNKFYFSKVFEGFTDEEFEILKQDYKTYLKKVRSNSIDFEFDDSLDIEDLITSLKNYDIENKFQFNYKNEIMSIIPDDGFKNLLKQNTNYFNFNIDSLIFQINIVSFKKMYINSIDIGNTIPERLLNLGLATKFYKAIVKRLKIVTTNKDVTNYIVYNIWSNLMVNTNFYAFTSNFMSGIIDKNANDSVLKNILDDLIYFKNKYNLIFDKDLEKKIMEIYGNVESYS